MQFSSQYGAGNVLSTPPDGLAPDGLRFGRALRGLFILLGASILVAGYITAGFVNHAANDLRAEQLTERTHVTATLLESADQALPDSSEPVHGSTQVPARWNTPAGGTTTALLAVATEADAGDERAVWVDSSGKLATPPLSPTQITFLAIAAGVSVNATGAALLFAAYRFIQRRAWQRRLRAWEAEWAKVGPQWTTR